ncbi:hypothetical protein PAMP_009118 [Pampus punctatissimus]
MKVTACGMTFRQVVLPGLMAVKDVSAAPTGDSVQFVMHATLGHLSSTTVL